MSSNPCNRQSFFTLKDRPKKNVEDRIDEDLKKIKEIFKMKDKE